MTKREAWQDDYEDYESDDEEIESYWREEYIDHPYGIIPEQLDSYVPPDKKTLKAERHQKKLQRQRKEQQ